MSNATPRGDAFLEAAREYVRAEDRFYSIQEVWHLVVEAPGKILQTLEYARELFEQKAREGNSEFQPQFIFENTLRDVLEAAQPMAIEASEQAAREFREVIEDKKLRDDPSAYGRSGLSHSFGIGAAVFHAFGIDGSTLQRVLSQATDRYNNGTDVTPITSLIASSILPFERLALGSERFEALGELLDDIHARVPRPLAPEIEELLREPTRTTQPPYERPTLEELAESYIAQTLAYDVVRPFLGGGRRDWTSDLPVRRISEVLQALQSIASNNMARYQKDQKFYTTPTATLLDEAQTSLAFSALYLTSEAIKAHPELKKLDQARAGFGGQTPQGNLAFAGMIALVELGVDAERVFEDEQYRDEVTARDANIGAFIERYRITGLEKERIGDETLINQFGAGARLVGYYPQQPDTGIDPLDL